jgi:hypothetical protein
VRLDWRTKLKVGSVTAVVGVLLFAFNNCGANHEGSSSSSSVAGLGPWTCADDLTPVTLFGRTYQPFLNNSCAGCHSGGGPGPGAFANSGLQVAYDSFNALGFTRINTMALETHSSGGAAGLQHRGTIDDLTYKYVTGLNAIDQCQAGGGGNEEDQDTANRIRFRSKGINPDPRAPVIVSWTLSADASASASFNPAQFSGIRLEAQVQIFERPGIINYVVSNPRLITTTSDIRIKSLLFKLNGSPTPSQRAFYLIEKDIRAWNNRHPDFNRTGPEWRYRAELISGGAMVMLGSVRTTDVLSVSVEAIETVTLPPPDLGPAVRFEAGTQSVVEGYRIVDIPLVLDRASQSVTYAEVVFGAETTIKDECCRSARNDNGDPINVRHFDRDIQDFDLDATNKINTRVNFDGDRGLRGRYLITFRDGEVRKTLRIKVLQDNRVEGNEVLHLRVDPDRLIGLQPAANLQDFRLSIIDSSPGVNYTAESYSDLLSDGGLLAEQCLRCHNSVLNRGGYDITHYELMVNRNILVPGAPTQSEMFRRMDQVIPGKLPMPLTGLLAPSDRSRVSRWILEGAPNN